MSSILKALQKLEQEKTARTTREPDIRAGISRRSRPQPERAKWILPVSMLAVAILSITATYLLMKKENRNTPPPEKSPLTAIKAPETPSPQQTGLSPELPPTIPVKPSTVQDRNIGTMQPTIPRSHAPLKQPTKMPSPVVPTKPANSPLPLRGQPVQPKADAVATQPLPAITINGIAWQKDSASRIAVVNGTPVSEGGTVQGTKVEEIFPDRIRFSHNGKPFEIPFGKGDH